MERYSSCYIMTVDPNWKSDVQLLNRIRQRIERENKHAKVKKRIVLRGRKPFRKLDRNCLCCGGATTQISYDRMGNIVGGLKNAQRLDVYIYDKPKRKNENTQKQKGRNRS